MPNKSNFKGILKTNTQLARWTSALLHPLHKKGDKIDLNGYKGISLLPVTYKILSKALLNRVERIFDPQLGENQRVFMKSGLCAEQIISLKNMLEVRKIRSLNLKCAVIFVDFKIVRFN